MRHTYITAYEIHSFDVYVCFPYGSTHFSLYTTRFGAIVLRCLGDDASSIQASQEPSCIYICDRNVYCALYYVCVCVLQHFAFFSFPTVAYTQIRRIIHFFFTFHLFL